MLWTYRADEQAPPSKYHAKACSGKVIATPYAFEHTNNYSNQLGKHLRCGWLGVDMPVSRIIFISSRDTLIAKIDTRVLAADQSAEIMKADHSHGLADSSN